MPAAIYLGFVLSLKTALAPCLTRAANPSLRSRVFFRSESSRKPGIDSGKTTSFQQYVGFAIWIGCH